MRWRLLVLTVAVLGPLALAGAARATPAVTGYPGSLAVLGDSISVGYDADGTGPQAEPQYSWGAGTSSQVDSVYSRILASNPAISGNGYNEAVKGADMADLEGQATTAVSQGAQEVLILMGANDVCTDTQATMTSVATFRAELKSALKTLSRGLPDARIQLLSIPNVYRLWQVLHTNATARLVWSFAGICQSMLSNPNSTAPADTARRAAVLKREKQFNRVLAATCATYVHCRFDGDAVFDYPFAASDADTLDYFHPSIVGQSILAQTVWNVGFDYTRYDAARVGGIDDPGYGRRPGHADRDRQRRRRRHRVRDREGTLGAIHRPGHRARRPRDHLARRRRERQHRGQPIADGGSSGLIRHNSSLTGSPRRWIVATLKPEPSRRGM